MHQTTLSAFMQTNPDGTLEGIAEEFGTTLLKVVEQLPNHILISGDHFDRIWDTVTGWGKVTTLVHTADIILEFTGELPSGFHRHGYYNLRGKQGLSGHIKAENCRHIALIERPFMGMETAAILFINQAESAMLKIFLGRDEHRHLLADQLSAFRTLAAALTAEQP